MPEGRIEDAAPPVDARPPAPQSEPPPENRASTADRQRAMQDPVVQQTLDLFDGIIVGVENESTGSNRGAESDQSNPNELEDDQERDDQE